MEKKINDLKPKFFIYDEHKALMYTVQQDPRDSGCFNVFGATGDWLTAFYSNTGSGDRFMSQFPRLSKWVDLQSDRADND